MNTPGINAYAVAELTLALILEWVSQDATS